MVFPQPTSQARYRLFLMYRVELKEFSFKFVIRITSGFLMYRVELKAPLSRTLSPLPRKFLMYRVELKVADRVELYKPFLYVFLMYRVELKDYMLNKRPQYGSQVPNVPCGVERHPCGAGEPLRRCVPNVPCGVERLS